MTMINEAIKPASFRELRQYESLVILKNKYEELHPGKRIDDRKLKSIAVNMKQGRELLQTARSSPHLTRPIAQYYGLAAFSRASALLFDERLTESALPSRHGLSIKSLPKNIQRGQDLLDLEIVIDDGIFSTWMERAQKCVSFRSNSNKPNVIAEYENTAIGKSIKLGNVLELIPELWTELNALNKKEYEKIFLTSQQINDTDYVWTLHGRSTEARVLDIFPNVDAKITHVNNENWTVIYSKEHKFTPQLAQLNEGSFNTGDILLVPPLSDDVELFPLAAYTISAYTISMLSRYRPSIWNDIWSLSGKDELYPLLERLMDIIQEWFPTTLAENLSNYKVR